MEKNKRYYIFITNDIKFQTKIFTIFLKYVILSTKLKKWEALKDGKYL